MPAADEPITTDPLREVRRRLDPTLQRAREALAADRKSDPATALTALTEAAEDAIATLAQAASNPPPDTPGQQPSDAAGPVA